MKVKELIKLLEALDGDEEIVVNDEFGLVEIQGIIEQEKAVYSKMSGYIKEEDLAAFQVGKYPLEKLNVLS